MNEALKSCISYIKKFPNNRRLQNDLIEIYTRLGKNQTAIDEVINIEGEEISIKTKEFKSSLGYLSSL